jgi:hypothetical protein
MRGIRTFGGHFRHCVNLLVRDLDATISNGSVTTRRMSLVSVGHSRLDSIVPLMLRMICCKMTEVLALYYRSLGTASTLLRRGNIWGNIWGRPYC